MRAKKKPTAFGRAVKLRLAELDMQLRDLAVMLGVSRTQITYIIYGERKCSDWVERICEVLDMPVKAKWKKGA